MSEVIEYGLAVAAELPAVVELCMEVEAQHEGYWRLRWERREGLAEGYLRWLTKRLGEPRMLIEVARVGGDGKTKDKRRKTKEEGRVIVGDASATAGVVAGMILVTIMEEVPIYTFKEYALVQDMAVRPEYRRRGVAMRLLADAGAWARGQGLNQLRLMVATQNPEARAVFEKAGFRETYREMVLGV